MLKTKAEIAQHFNKVFSSCEFVDFIKEKSACYTDEVTALKVYFANIIYYTIATRSPVLDKSVLQKLGNTQDLMKGHFLAGKEVADELVTQLSKPNQILKTQTVLNLLKNNYHTNGFYMHAFNPVFEEAIKQNGITRAKKGVDEINVLKNKLEGHIHYPYSDKSYRLFVTSKYEVLYNYGVLSPEWFAYMVKDNNTLLCGDKNIVAKTIIDNIIKEAGSVKKLELDKITADVKRLCDITINKQNYINFAIFDKNIQSESGLRIFPEYFEEDGLKNINFDVDYLNNTVLVNSERKLPDTISKSNPKDMELLGNVVNAIIKKGAVYELSTYFDIGPSDIEIFRCITPNVVKKQEPKNQLER